MGGDLNLKKSWHPHLLSNQKRVWQEEKKALEERKRTDQMMKERQEERNMQEIQQLAEANGGTKRQVRVDWMYSGPASGQAGTTEEMEGYLLGKRRIDGLIKGTENQKLEKSSTEASFMAIQNANTARDTAAKVREDPMLAIKKQEQAAYEAMMNDPMKRRMLLKAVGRGEPDTKERDRKRRKHHHRHRDEDESRRSRNHSRRYEDDKDRYSGSIRHEDSADRYERSERKRRKRSYSSSMSRSRSGSPPPRMSRRSRSPYRRRRSYSPELRNRSRSPYQGPERDRGVRKMQSWHSSAPPGQNISRSPRQQDAAPVEDNKAAKLAAMQQAASELDQDRERRLAAIAARDKVEAERDENARAQNAKYGGRADFVNGLNRKAGDMNLGERIGRGKAGMEREQEA